MNFERRLLAALNARTYPKDPEYGLDEIQPEDEPVARIPRDAAHLLVLFNEYMMGQAMTINSPPPDKHELLVIENLWYIRLRELVAEALGMSPQELTEEIMADYEVRKGWKLCKTCWWASSHPPFSRTI